MPFSVILSPQAVVYQEIRAIQALLETYGVTPTEEWQTLEPDERRQEDRLLYPGFARCYRMGSLEPEVIAVLDISVRGMQFRMRRLVEVGERLRVELTLPNGKTRDMDMIVRWVSASQQGQSARVGAAIHWV